MRRNVERPRYRVAPYRCSCSVSCRSHPHCPLPGSNQRHASCRSLITTLPAQHATGDITNFRSENIRDALSGHPPAGAAVPESRNPGAACRAAKHLVRAATTFLTCFNDQWCCKSGQSPASGCQPGCQRVSSEDLTLPCPARALKWMKNRLVSAVTGLVFLLPLLAAPARACAGCGTADVAPWEREVSVHGRRRSLLSMRGRRCGADGWPSIA